MKTRLASFLTAPCFLVLLSASIGPGRSALGRPPIEPSAEDIARTEYDALTETLQRDPGNMEAFLSRARVCHQLRMTAEADEDYEHAIRAAPGSSVPYQIRGQDHFDDGRYDEAFRDMDEAIRLDPANLTLRYLRGCMHAKLRHSEQAVADFDFVLARQHDDKGFDGLIRRNRGIALLYGGDAAAALAELERAKAEGSDSPMGRGEALVELKRWPEAVKVFDQIIEFCAAMPGQADEHPALCYRAQAEEELKDYPAAETDLAAAIKLKPWKIEAYGAAAHVNLLAGHPDQARKVAQRALELDKTQKQIRLDLAHAFLLTDQYDLARDIYVHDRDETFGEGKTGAQMVLEAFAELRAAGVTHPDMARIEALLKEQPASPSN